MSCMSFGGTAPAKWLIVFLDQVDNAHSFLG